MDAVDQKWKVIDDHTEAANNLAAGRSQKIPMSSVGQALNVSKAVALHSTGHEDRPLLISEDLKSVYRQIPLLSSQTMLCLLAVLCPTTGTAFLFEPFAQPFVSASAVPNFYKCEDLICELGQKYLSLCMDHFFDDFWVIEPEYSVASAQTALRGLLDVLGFKWDLRKSQGPTDNGTILGVQLDLTRARDSLLTARPKPGRVESVQKEVLAILESGRLPGSQSAHIAGKADFLSTTIFGKVGRCCLASLKARQYAEHKKAALTPWLQASLQCLYVLIGEAPPHTINFRCEETDVIHLYTDGAAKMGTEWLSPGSVSKETLADLRIGLVLVQGSTVRYADASVPLEAARRWLQRQQQVALLELLAPVAAIHLWPHILKNQHVILWLDNSNAFSALVKGYSGKLDITELAGTFWINSARLSISWWLDRESSAANMSDGPSRQNYSLMKKLVGIPEPLSWSWLEQGGSDDPLSWFKNVNRAALET
jgi:hypothetical protein